MSDKDQKKKDSARHGQEAAADEAERQIAQAPSEPSKQSRDEVDTVKFKPGSAGDKSRRGAP
jgi:hypothetical protein